MKKEIIVLHLFLILTLNSRQMSFSIPGKSWCIVLNLSGFEVYDQRFSSTGEARYIYLSDNAENIYGMINIEPIMDASVKKLSEIYAREINTQYKKSVSNMKKGIVNDVFVIWYKIKTEEVKVIDNIVSFIVHNDYQIVVNFSSDENNVYFKEKTDSIISSIVITEYCALPAEELYEFGKFFFLNQNFFRAVDYFSEILLSYDYRNIFSYEMFSDFINLSSYAYAVTGAADIALDILKTGIQKYPEEPLFYYNTAVNTAFFGFEQEALENIELAFYYASRKSGTSGLPDPFSDPAFHLLLRNKSNREYLIRIIENTNSYDE